MEHDTRDAPEQVSPGPLIDMRSTEVPERLTGADGTVTEGTVHVVHRPGAAVPQRLDTTALPGDGATRTPPIRRPDAPPLPAGS